MSEEEQERPLTRRELRLREQAEREGVDLSDAIAANVEEASLEAAAKAEAELPLLDVSSVEIEIDPLNPDGTPRSRREMRELREAAIAEIALAQGIEAEVPAPVSAVPAEADDSYGAPTEAMSLEELSGDRADSAEELDAPTEAFTLEDILDAAEPTSPTGDADAVANLFAAEEEDSSEDADADADADAEEVDLAAVEEDEAEADASSSDAADSLSEDEAEPVDDEGDVEEAAAEPAASTDDEAAEAAASDDDTASEDEGDTGTDTAGYSFPDIQPPEEWRSVFDDPSRGANMATPSPSGDFDDLISRAVAQEGSTGGTGASALILPSHPGDTGGLTGPLGATGELFVTGSIELPRSLGETGGHSALHDSIDFDPFLTGESTESIGSVSESGPMPVSALNAVSARRRPEVPVVAEPTKDRSKMPLVLALSGGGLIVVLAGAVIYAATQGLFN